MSDVFRKEAEQLVQDTKAKFGNLNASQLNWKPNADQWSVGQCFDHLLTTNQGYMEIFEKISRGEKETRLWERMPLLPGFFGSMMKKGVAPQSKRKFKAPQMLRPASSAVETEVIDKFTAQIQQLISLMQATSKLDNGKIVLTSPVSKIVTLNLQDAYSIMLLHARRHFLQAQRVSQLENFPR
jgi:hypothetical protein